MVQPAGIGDQPIEGGLLQVEMVAVAVDAVAAEHQFFDQADPGTDAGIVKNDRVVDRGAFTDVATGANHGGADDGGAILDPGHATHIDGTLDCDLVPIGGHIQAGVDARAHLLAGDLHLAHFPLQHAADRLPVIGHLADIYPFKFHRQGVEGCALLNQ